MVQEKKAINQNDMKNKLTSVRGDFLIFFLNKKCFNCSTFSAFKHTRQIAEKQWPLIPVSMIGIERIEDIEKKRFLYKNIFMSKLF